MPPPVVYCSSCLAARGGYALRARCDARALRMLLCWQQ
jgi:hypothetical protein